MSFSHKSAHPKHASLGGSLNRASPLSTSAEYTTRSFVTEQRTRTLSDFGSRPITPVVVEPRSVIQKEQWLEAARRSTEHFKRQGSPVPLVWVLTKGNEIPDNAVPFGEDRNGCTTYIARALLEGSLHIGKASPQFAGAVIGFAGKEHIISHYEVLVCASQLRWGFPAAEPEGVLAQGTVIFAQQRTTRTSYRSKSRSTEVDQLNTTLVEADIPRYIPDAFNISSDREAGLRRLAEIKTVIVIDDSMSMHEGNLWEQAREALAGIVDIANKYESKGTDIHFMHGDDYAPNMQSRAEVVALFNRVMPEGEDTPTGAKLDQIINHYLPLVEREGSTHEPITVLVITDGLPTDQADLEKVIVNAAHRLDRQRARHDMFGIQFVQIGTDPAASELLHTLDDHLKDRYKIRDIVDSTPYDPAYGVFDTEYMLKILLGSLNKDLDHAGPNSGQPSLLSPLGSSAHLYERSPRGLTARLAPSSPRLATLSPMPGY
ncbi:hypothetical protein J3R82DRAFT_8758 [Butyriboletus roseoflavus]|nr:hypothetical protein J3R82DRAFT_8758 [Butyriboletus roseoflavus]